MRRWDNSEINRLVVLFPYLKDQEVADLMHRSIQSIRCRARRLGLYKSKDFLLQLQQETAQNISSGPHRHQFSQGPDPAIFRARGSKHPRWVQDRSKIKGPRRKQHRFSTTVMAATRARQVSLCNICSEHVETGEFDHIIPVCIGGTSEIGNCQLLCYACHSYKSRNDQGISNNYLDLNKLREAYSFIGRNLV